MCGICGDIRARQSAPDTVVAMTAAMADRGPDAMGLFVQGNAALGHRRLKIFDLSERAGQPMVDAHLGLSMVYNGAIYNYQELRKELEGKGYDFFSTGDTEVVLKAYHAWGRNCLQRLNGMFAFAVWHRDTGDLFIARDRLGIKPLYYISEPDRFRFASSLPALLAGGDVDATIDPAALHHYMTFHSIVPPPRTLLKGVKKLPPGTTLTLRADGTIHEERYWTLDVRPDPETAGYGEDDWRERTLLELEKAVARRQIADVPVGVLLSGGLDSSLVVGLLARSGQSDLNTFSIGFESAGGERGDEFHYSDVIAEHFGAVHHKIEVDAKRVLPSMEACVRAMSEPMVSHDCIGFFLLGQEVSKHLKVVQSGQGADEIFAGYHWYPPMLETDDPLATYRKVFFDGDQADFARAVHPRFVSADFSAEFVAARFDSLPDAPTPADKALHLDTTVMLIDDPVKRVDNMTMAWGLEARVPFLDHELVEFAARIPAELKIREGGKFILKEAARKVIPAHVIDRPKGYFPVPALKYFRGDYLNFVTDILTDPTSREREIFRPEYVDQALKNPDDHITPLRGSRLWQMALLQYWLTVHGL
ncbi:MAG: N-acetylglutaminylglutamine amidotransferase [Desulfococcaceae bacterium]